MPWLFDNRRTAEKQLISYVENHTDDLQLFHLCMGLTFTAECLRKFWRYHRWQHRCNLAKGIKEGTGQNRPWVL